MNMKRMAAAVAALLSASLLQGCAVFYTIDKTDANGSTERQFGLFNGCLPLWHYRSMKAAGARQPQAKTDDASGRKLAFE